MNTVYFWHGWGLGPFVWDNWIKTLQEENSKYQWVSEPLAGYDHSLTSPPLLEGLLDVTKISDDSIICAWSMGALLALLAAYRFPQKIKKLILIGATPCFLNKKDWNNGLDPTLLTQLRQNVQENVATTMRRFVALFNQNDQQARTITRSFSSTTYPSLEVLDAGLNILESTDLREIIPHISQKTLLLHGENDPLMPLSAAKWLENHLPYATLSVFKNVAHAPFLSAPKQCALQMLQFLDDQ